MGKIRFVLKRKLWDILAAIYFVLATILMAGLFVIVLLKLGKNYFVGLLKTPPVDSTLSYLNVVDAGFPSVQVWIIASLLTATAFAFILYRIGKAVVASNPPC